ncbi:MAG: hypothetical protein A2901_03170 [Elusimicrobia bacterium RIFCSPLOWO2_01_FULL_54_10]|nr:MAG: hypothetical protein A2901_03170 [Elusimicrobia bacterium RIFCSPLOWO2_01_FULL_54_10]
MKSPTRFLCLSILTAFSFTSLASVRHFSHQTQTIAKTQPRPDKSRSSGAEITAYRFDAYAKKEDWTASKMTAGALIPLNVEGTQRPDTILLTKWTPPTRGIRTLIAFCTHGGGEKPTEAKS